MLWVCVRGGGGGEKVCVCVCVSAYGCVYGCVCESIFTVTAHDVK